MARRGKGADMTLLEFIKILEGVASRQPAVKMIVRDSVLRLNDNPSDKYGAFVWTQGQHTEGLDSDFRTLRFSLFYVDRLLNDKSNQAEIQSTGIEVLSNTIRTLANEFEVNTWSIDTFTQRFTDECAGAWATVAFLVPVNGTCPAEFGTGMPYKVIKRAPFAYEAWYDDIDYRLNENALLPIGGCSSFLAGTEYGRNLDWNYDRHAECVVHLTAGAGRYSSVSVCGNLAGFDDISGYTIPEEKWKMIPCRVLDGRNSEGVIVNTNVVPIEPDTDFEYCTPASGEWETELSAVMIPRYVLDHFATAREAAEYLRDKCRVHIPAALRQMGYRAHYAILDGNGQMFIIEMVDGRIKIVEGLSQMTNFVTDGVTPNADGTVYTPADSGHSAVTDNGIQPHGSGLERWNLIVGMRNAGNDAEQICRALFYSSAYNPETSPYWHTEFTGADMGGKDLRVDTDPSEFADYEQTAQTAWNERTRETGEVWHTTHSTIYDIANGTMKVCFQENGNFETIG